MRTLLIGLRAIFVGALMRHDSGRRGCGGINQMRRRRRALGAPREDSPEASGGISV
jgi:hypothetical protein